MRAWLADGFFAGTVDALFTSIFSLLDKHAVPKDSAAKFSLPGEYVTTGSWRPVLSNERPRVKSQQLLRKKLFLTYLTWMLVHGLM